MFYDCQKVINSTEKEKYVSTMSTVILLPYYCILIIILRISYCAFLTTAIVNFKDKKDRAASFLQLSS